MVEKIYLDKKEYEIDPNNLSARVTEAFKRLEFASKRISELNNMQALLHRARNSYLADMKTEMISNKAGVMFGED